MQAFINGNELGAAMNLAGAIPAVGDMAKVSGTIGLFITKYPGKLSDIAKAQVKYLKYADEATKLNALDTIYDGAATALKKGDINADDIFKVVESNGDLSKTLGVVKRSDGSIRWLEEGLTEAEAKAIGKTPTGWRHIFEKHVMDYNNIELNQFAKAFDPLGTNYRNAESIQNLIYTSIREGKLDSSTGIYYYKVTADKYLKTIPGSNGYIRTSYPVRLEDVPSVLR